MCSRPFRPLGWKARPRRRLRYGPIYVARCPAAPFPHRCLGAFPAMSLVPVAPLYLARSRSARPLPSRLFRPCRSSHSLHSTLQGPRSIPRYSVNVCDWYRMPLESCPACGYALSIVDHHCRHCITASPAIPSRLFDAKHLQQKIIMVVVGLSVLVYLIFVR